MSDFATVDTTLEADIESVWKAMTSPEGIEEWMGEGSVLPPEEGRELWLRDFVTGSPKVGRVREVEPDRRLSFDWWPDDDPTDRSSVSITLEPATAGTRVTVTEQPAGPVSARCTADWLWRSATLTVLTTRTHHDRRVLGAC